MDIACNFRQSNLFHRSEVTGYSTSDRLDSHLKFRFRSIGCNFLGNQRLLSKSYMKNMVKKITVSSTNSSVHSSVLGKIDFDNNLWGYNSRGSLICNFVNVFKTSRGVVRLRCQGNDSIADIDVMLEM